MDAQCKSFQSSKSLAMTEEEYDHLKYNIENLSVENICDWLNRNNVLKFLSDGFRNQNVNGMVLIDIYDNQEEEFQKYNINTIGLKKNFQFEFFNLFRARNSYLNLTKNKRDILRNDIDDISALLLKRNLGNLVYILKNQHINGIALIQLTNQCMKDLGLNIGQREDLLELIESLK